MRVLVIGGDEIVGHLLIPYLLERTPYEVFCTTRQKSLLPKGLYLDANDDVMVEKLIDIVAPDVIVNGTSIVNDMARQREVEAYRINGLLPHQLVRLANRHNIRLIHMSTDGVFSGQRGLYEERHIPEGTSVYAKTKALGEINQSRHVTIRTSLIGPEPDAAGIGLLDWFLRQKGDIRGFVNVMWNGVTSLELAKFIHFTLEQGKHLSGIVHLTSPEIISKYDLLLMLQQLFHRNEIRIHPYDGIELDRTLKCTRQDIGYEVPSYASMLSELLEFMRIAW
ncbi:SDR family oxidoreductase [Paenibacillus sp. NPDC056579]|uniref:SDR family oxidoreductase n=1 Tax=Paenibacillus sp. NPDC056579 TaxID=3345871 RepID=UPI0036B00B4E